jgi:hypothetical protein
MERAVHVDEAELRDAVVELLARAGVRLLGSEPRVDIELRPTSTSESVRVSTPTV